jgi:hypothetical protein
MVYRIVYSEGVGDGTTMFDLKTLSLGALIGFLLSFLVGVVNVIPFGYLLLRALLFAVLGGTLALLARFVFKKYLPEAFTEDGAPGGASEAESLEPEAVEVERGGKIDIVLPEEAAPRARDEKEAEELDRELETEAEEMSKASLVEEVEPVDEEPARPVRPPTTIDDVDVLPDLDSFSDSFVAPVADEEAGPQMRESVAPSGASRREGGDDSNPEMIAKAVRTLLQRDQKG